MNTPDAGAHGPDRVPLCMAASTRNVALALLAVCLATLASCDKPTAPGAGESVGGTAEPDKVRIVAISPAVAVMLRDLGFERQIVGRHGYDLVLEPSVPVAGDQAGVDYETLIGLNPTHVYTQFGTLGVPERLSELAAERGWALEDVRLTTLDEIARSMDDMYLDLRGFEPQGADEFDPIKQFERTVLPSERLAFAWRDRGPAVRDAGRVLLVAATEPPGVLGPGSFHHELLIRIGGTPAITEGGPWMELDAEDVLRVAPDAIVVITTTGHPGRGPEGDARFVAPAELSWDETRGYLGVIGGLPIPAVRERRVAVIDDGLALLPSSSLADFADALAGHLEGWSAERAGTAGDAPGGP